MQSSYSGEILLIPIISGETGDSRVHVEPPLLNPVSPLKRGKRMLSYKSYFRLHLCTSFLLLSGKQFVAIRRFVFIESCLVSATLRPEANSWIRKFLLPSMDSRSNLSTCQLLAFLELSDSRKEERCYTIPTDPQRKRKCSARSIFRQKLREPVSSEFYHRFYTESSGTVQDTSVINFYSINRSTGYSILYLPF